jgi:hypothetical protein
MADVYQFYFPNQAVGPGTPIEQWANAKVINTSSYTTYDGKLTGFYTLDFTNLEEPARLANPGANYGAAVRYDTAVSPITILDFVGTNLKIRKNAAVDLAEVGAAPGTGYTYDLVANVNLQNGQVVETILIASNEAAAAIARAAGYSVILDKSNLDSNGQVAVFTSFSANITNENLANVTTDGGLLVKKVQAGDGTSLVRQDADGTLHIGENSVRISLTGKDRIDSTVGELYIGNRNGHRTIIEGTLEIQDPTAPNHAATKRYVDAGAAMAMAMSAIPKASGTDSYLGFAVGSHGDQQAIAFGLSRNIAARNLQVNLNAGYSEVGRGSIAAGVGWKF